MHAPQVRDWLAEALLLQQSVRRANGLAQAQWELLFTNLDAALALRGKSSPL